MDSSFQNPAHGDIDADSAIQWIDRPRELTKTGLRRWLARFREREKETTGAGRWPDRRDACVWDRNEHGAWVRVRDESWALIHASLLHGGSRVAQPLRSYTLERLKQECGCHPGPSKQEILEWADLFYRHEKEITGAGRLPCTLEDAVWYLDRNGEWALVAGKNWNAIDIAIRRGRCGPGIPAKRYTLGKLLEEEGFDTDKRLSKTEIVRWMKLFYEHEEETGRAWIEQRGKSMEVAVKGRYPKVQDACIWDRDRDGRWFPVQTKTWASIERALLLGSVFQGPPPGTPLKRFKRSLDMSDDFTDDRIAAWIAKYREKTGRLPVQYDQIVWDRNARGKWVVVADTTWRAIDSALIEGLRGRKETGSSLSRFKARYFSKARGGAFLV